MKILTILALVMASFFTTHFFTSIKSDKKSEIYTQKEPTFKKFIKGFKRVKMPFKVTAKDLSVYEYSKDNFNQKIEYKYVKVFNDLYTKRFSRAPISANNHYLAKLKETSKYIAILYIKSTRISLYKGGSNKAVSCNLVTFSKDGKVIDIEKNIAYIGNRPQNYSFSIDKNLKITQESYKCAYKQDPKKVGYKNNQMIDKKLLEITKFYISDSGKIEEIKQPAKASS